jgi:hypothetical protein
VRVLLAETALPPIHSGSVPFVFVSTMLIVSLGSR